MFDTPFPMFWLILGIIFVIAEASTAALISIWFAVGSIASMFVALLGLPFWLQALVFLAVSGIVLLLTKPLAQKVKQKIVPTNADRIIGQLGKVIQTIDNLSAKGQVDVAGQTWTARSYNDSIIEEGEIVEIKEISGVKVLVTKKEG